MADARQFIEVSESFLDKATDRDITAEETMALIAQAQVYATLAVAAATRSAMLRQS